MPTDSTEKFADYALFGGTFDPVHIGHLAIVDSAIRHGGIKRLILLPAAVPPHKRHRHITDAQHRLTMLRLAFPDASIEISDYELHAPRPSYTIRTVRHFITQYAALLPPALLIGGDSLDELHTWFAAEELVRLCPLLVFRRPGSSIADIDSLRPQFSPETAAHLRIRWLPGAEIPVSSTEIRKRLSSGQTVDHLLPAAVLDYIRQHHLYEVG